MKGFPAEIRHFASMFVTLQEERHRADYVIAEHFYKSDVLATIHDAESALAAYKRAGRADQRTFMAHALFKRRPS